MTVEINKFIARDYCTIKEFVTNSAVPSVRNLKKREDAENSPFHSTTHLKFEIYKHLFKSSKKISVTISVPNGPEI